MKRKSLSLALLSFAFLSVGAHASNLVVDGNFEGSNSTVWINNYNNMIGAWGVPGTAGRSLNLSYGGSGGCDAMQLMDLSKYKGAVLSFDLTTIAHGFDQSGEFAVSMGYDNTLFSTFVGSTTDGLVTEKHITVDFTSPAAFKANTFLIFGAIQAPGVTDKIYVDNISIQPMATPEPATYGALGLGVLTLVRRRKKA